MTAFLEIYLSSYWAWSGITIGAATVLGSITATLDAWRK